MFKPVLAAVLAAGAVVSVASVASVRAVRSQPAQPDRAAEQDWPFYGGDPGGAKYSPLTDINAASVTRLSVAWEWATRRSRWRRSARVPRDFRRRR
jgi:glucose dehydrogenase